MKLALKVNGADDAIELLAPASPEGAPCRFRLNDGVDRAADVEMPEPGVYSILMDGRSYDAHVEESADGLVVTVSGRRFEIEVRDPRQWARKGAGSGKDGVETVAAPMPGKVVRVLVAPGDAVERGQGIVVVEAMKMQNEMKAARAGRVLAVRVQVGAAVSAGEVLATIE